MVDEKTTQLQLLSQQLNEFKKEQGGKRDVMDNTARVKLEGKKFEKSAEFHPTPLGRQKSMIRKTNDQLPAESHPTPLSRQKSGIRKTHDQLPNLMRGLSMSAKEGARTAIVRTHDLEEEMKLERELSRALQDHLQSVRRHGALTCCH